MQVKKYVIQVPQFGMVNLVISKLLNGAILLIIMVHMLKVPVKDKIILMIMKSAKKCDEGFNKKWLYFGSNNFERENRG